MNKHVVILILVLGGFFGCLQAQETLVSDPVAVPAFSGQVSYKLAYAGKLSYAQKHWLPDSMLVTAVPPRIHIQYFGGMSDSLMHDIYWNSEEVNYLLVDHAGKTAYYPTVPEVSPIPKRELMDNQSLEILGHSCEAWSVSLPGESNLLWLSEDLRFPLPAEDTTKGLRPVFFQAGLAAIPLKMVRTYKGVVITTIAVDVRPLPTEAALNITPPADYARTSFEGRMNRHPITKMEK